MWLAGWFLGWLVYWLAGWLAVWPAGWMAGLLAGRPAGWQPPPHLSEPLADPATLPSGPSPRSSMPTRGTPPNKGNLPAAYSLNHDSIFPVSQETGQQPPILESLNLVAYTRHDASIVSPLPNDLVCLWAILPTITWGIAWRVQRVILDRASH